MAAYDLTTLANLKAWISQTATGDDALLARLITQTSRTILNFLNRGSLLPFTYNETYDGHGGIRLFIKNWPIISINSLTINGSLISVSPPLAANSMNPGGYVLEEAGDPMPPGNMQQLSLRGFCFQRGIQNVTVNYSAGYQTTAEPQTVPISSPYQIIALQPYGAWATDEGVAYASGAALARVQSSPSAGQYAVSSLGAYTFAAADAGLNVLLSYGFIPSDLAMNCEQWIGEIYRYREHIGQTSKSLGGQETVSYDTKAIPPRVEASLQNYRRVVPL